MTSKYKVVIDARRTHPELKNTEVVERMVVEDGLSWQDAKEARKQFGGQIVPQVEMPEQPEFHPKQKIVRTAGHKRHKGDKNASS